LPLHDTRQCNVAAQQSDSGSMLMLTRALIALRRQEPALSIGAYGLIEARGDVLVYERHHRGRRLAVLLNFADSTIYTPLDGAGTRLLSTHPGPASEHAGPLVRLRPREGIVLEVSRQA
jgi:alpha-glucosidase